MAESKRRLDRVLEEGFLDDLQGRSIDDVRLMRSDVAQEEAQASYERRLLHGRLAILKDELERRSTSGEPARSLVERLTEILTDERPTTNRGSFPSKDPDLSYGEPSRRVTKLVSDDTIARLPSLDEDEIRRIVEVLQEAEREASATRRRLLDVLDALNAELTRRYQRGEADPSDVLTGR